MGTLSVLLVPPTRRSAALDIRREARDEPIRLILWHVGRCPVVQRKLEPLRPHTCIRMVIHECSQDNEEPQAVHSARASIGAACTGIEPQSVERTKWVACGYVPFFVLGLRDDLLVKPLKVVRRRFVVQPKDAPGHVYIFLWVELFEGGDEPLHKRVCSIAYRV